MEELWERKIEFLNDSRISLKAKGLYLYLCTKEVDWDFSVMRMAAELKEGTTALYVAMDELEEFEMLERIKVANGKMRCVLNELK